MNIIQALEDAEDQRTIAIIGSLSATTTRQEVRNETLLATLHVQDDKAKQERSVADKSVIPSDKALTAR